MFSFIPGLRRQDPSPTRTSTTSTTTTTTTIAPSSSSASSTTLNTSPTPTNTTSPTLPSTTTSVSAHHVPFPHALHPLPNTQQAPSYSHSRSSSLHPQLPHPHPHLPATPSSPAEITSARNAVVASIGNLLDRELQGRAAVLHANNAAIEKQERDVARAREGLRRENDKLAKLAEEHTRKVKEIGNVQNWAEMLEREFLILEETVRLVDGGSEGSWEGSECGSDCDCGREVGGEERRRDAEGDVVMGGVERRKGRGMEPEEVPLPESPRVVEEDQAR